MTDDSKILRIAKGNDLKIYEDFSKWGLSASFVIMYKSTISKFPKRKLQFLRYEWEVSKKYKFIILLGGLL